MDIVYIVMESEDDCPTQNMGAYRTKQGAEREVARLTWRDENLDVIGKPVCTYYIMEAKLKG